MNRETFARKIVKELENLDKKDLVYIAWRSAIYSLPIIGQYGDFSYWIEKYKLKYLSDVFYGLDLCANYANSPNIQQDITSLNNEFTNDTSYTYHIEAVSFNAAELAKGVDSTASIKLALSSFEAAVSTVYASSATETTIPSYDLTTDATTEAIMLSIDAFSADIDSYINPLEIINQTLEEEVQYTIIDNIKSLGIGKRKMKGVAIKSYGMIWDNFMLALKKEGCDYWADLYTQFFENNLEIDLDSLNQRIGIPEEIRIQGAAVFAHYLQEIEKRGAKHLNEARIIILGDKGAGKTCLARRLINPNAPMTKKNESTAGVETSVWKIENGKTVVHIWDFAGHTITHAAHKFFLSERCLYIIVYNGRTEDNKRLKYWLDHMKNYGGNSEAIILVNKLDAHTPKISINSLRNKYPIVKNIGFHIFSIKSIKEVRKFREIIADYIQNKPSWNIQIIPKNYYEVKTKIEELFIKDGKENISKNEFEFIAKTRNIINGIVSDKLLKDLNDLGICLWYPDIKEFDTLVLNPEWISYGVYKIINWVHENKKSSISLFDLKNIFTKNDSNRFPLEKHEFLFRLMIKYELAYEYKSNEVPCLIIPLLLEEDRPEELPYFPVGESVMFRYVADHDLPPDTITRFIVRHNEDIMENSNGEFLVWRYGVVLFTGNDTIAQVQEDDRIIEISVKGKNKTVYSLKLKETLDTIFKSYKSDQPELQYRIDAFGEIPQEHKTNEYWESISKIIGSSAKGLPLYDHKNDQIISLQALLNFLGITSSKTIIDIGGVNINININDVQKGNFNTLESFLNEIGVSVNDIETLKEIIELYELSKDNEDTDLEKDEWYSKIIDRITLSETFLNIMTGATGSFVFDAIKRYLGG